MCSGWGLTTSCLGVLILNGGLFTSQRRREFWGKGFGGLGTAPGRNDSQGTPAGSGRLRESFGLKVTSSHRVPKGRSQGLPWCQVLCAPGLQIQIRRLPHLPGQPGVQVDSVQGSWGREVLGKLGRGVPSVWASPPPGASGPGSRARLHIALLSHSYSCLPPDMSVYPGVHWVTVFTGRGSVTVLERTTAASGQRAQQGRVLRLSVP